MSLTKIIKILIVIMLFPVVANAETDKEFVVMIDPVMVVRTPALSDGAPMKRPSIWLWQRNFRSSSIQR